MVWKKQEPAPTPQPAPREPQAAPQQKPAAPPQQARTTVAKIGPSIAIEGDLKGKEDLLIEGKVRGTIQVEQHLVTIGSSGQVHAHVYGKAVRVEGEVVGDLFGSEEIVIRKSGKVEGNLTAPRVTLEDGSTFRGSIDMSAPKEPSVSSSGVSADKSVTEAAS